jgi:hypothetical protein
MHILLLTFIDFMIILHMKFPRGKPILENTRLEFINIDKLLSASKRERAHRISGYISILYHDMVELILLKEGEPFNAIRISPNVREIVPINEVVEKAKRSNHGILAEYAVDETLLNLIISSVILKPMKADIDLSRVQPKIFLDKLKTTKFNGFIVAKSGIGESFICFNNGDIAGCYVTGSTKQLTGDAILTFLNTPKLTITVFDHVEEVAAKQATPAQFDMFRKIFSSLLQGYAHPLGQTLVLKTVMMAKATVQKEFPFIEQCKIGSDLTITGNFAVDPKILAQGMARWFDLIVESFSTLLGKESEVIAKKVVHDYRFALKSVEFFEYSKLKV